MSQSNTDQAQAAETLTQETRTFIRQVRTKKADGEFHADLEEIGQQYDHVAALVEEIDWEQVRAYGGNQIQDS